MSSALGYVPMKKSAAAIYASHGARVEAPNDIIVAVTRKGWLSLIVIV